MGVKQDGRKKAKSWVSRTCRRSLEATPRGPVPAGGPSPDALQDHSACRLRCPPPMLRADERRRHSPRSRSRLST